MKGWKRNIGTERTIKWMNRAIEKMQRAIEWIEKSIEGM
jgi:hypothetical protein